MTPPTTSVRRTARRPAASGAAPSIPLGEFASRRERVLKALEKDGGAIGLVLAGDADPSLSSAWRPCAHFEYLTGIADEPGAVLLLDPGHPVAGKRAQLFLKPLNPEVEKWDGFRATVSSALKSRYGIETIMRTLALPRMLLESTRRSKRFAALHPLSPHNAPVSPDLAILRECAARIPSSALCDQSNLINSMRSVKSACEIAMIQRACDITARGFAAIPDVAQAGKSEFDVQEAAEHAYKTSGATSTAYRTIAGAGFNSTVLHYHANNATLRDGDLIVVDSGASFGGYAADVTRTFAVSGKFTPRQRQVYDIVLEAQLAAIRACRPGATMAQVDSAARKVIAKAGLGDYFIHGIGHHLGLEVHDADPQSPLKPGMIVTIEPGVYIPEESLGVRIEDDILVTSGAPKVLTAAIPK